VILRRAGRRARAAGLAVPVLAEIDNNPAENAIRTIALGRKNWLFIGDREAGRAAANLLTIITTCKNAGDDPYACLLDVMRTGTGTSATKGQVWIYLGAIRLRPSTPQTHRPVPSKCSSLPRFLPGS